MGCLLNYFLDPLITHLSKDLPSFEKSSSKSSRWRVLSQKNLKSFKQYSSLKETVLKCTSFLKRISYENSTFFSLDNNAIAKSKEGYSHLNWRQKFTVGIGVGIAFFVPRVIFIAAASLIVSKLNPKESMGFRFTIREAALCSILEQVICRTIAQNAIALIQKIPFYITPDSCHDNRVFVWITSPSARILCVNGLFAVVNLFNGGNYLSAMDCIIQTSAIFLSPNETTLYEITNSLAAPLGCHLATSFFTITP